MYVEKNINNASTLYSNHVEFCICNSNFSFFRSSSYRRRRGLPFRSVGVSGKYDVTARPYFLKTSNSHTMLDESQPYSLGIQFPFVFH